MTKTSRKFSNSRQAFRQLLCKLKQKYYQEHQTEYKMETKYFPQQILQ